MGVSLIHLLIKKDKNNQKIIDFFKTLKNKTPVDLGEILPPDLNPNLKLVLGKMINVNPQNRPSSFALSEVLSSENFLSMKLSDPDFVHPEPAIGDYALDECELGKTGETNIPTNDIESHLISGHQNKNIVFDFEFLSNKTKRGSLSTASKNSILNSILDFPLSFPQSDKTDSTKKSQSHDTSPEKHFKFPSFIDLTSNLKMDVLSCSKQKSNKESGYQYFKEFQLKDPSKNSNLGYFCQENDFSKRSSDVWI